ncbi:phosphatase PAP2 family protein [Bacillus sp. DNRA2]|uniref:phosphatase PAP2 family protein n=1 Tax=Bacillus sp. DNRA2 TaxID=2723053 RepID=UPI00145E7190|nr:phosphatase PAP2 family protein [Bacillus sp. DNRA2]NMD69069.1 phosphatase PAP2 family protein [Bacillus sp. DNRA2]
MSRLLNSFYLFECRVFKEINRHFEKRLLNLFFRSITHCGGAGFTISVTLLLLILLPVHLKWIAVASAASLSLSHIPVHFIKKLYPRQRPYLTLDKINIPRNPLKDHSFPSGHTTAIFSVMIPFVLFAPALSFLLIPAGICVGLSRMYLGLHYPSDVMAGGILGSTIGAVCFYFINSFL